MTYTLEQFAADSHDILSSDSGPSGRERVRAGLERLLAEPDFVRATWGDETGAGVKLLHDDRQLGFRILAHTSGKAHASAPHNHGASWAIYGQATLYSDMTEWTRDDSVSDGQLKPVTQYRLAPGQTGIYQDGAIHSVSHPEGSRIIRITGTDLDKIDRDRFDLETGEVHNMKKQLVS